MDEYGLMKILACAFGAWVVVSTLTACGATNGNFTIGTTSFLEEVNVGALDGNKIRRIKHERR